jgi:hypothetical protein
MARVRVLLNNSGSEEHSRALTLWTTSDQGGKSTLRGANRHFSVGYSTYIPLEEKTDYDILKERL